jgi:hypothetical protein
LCFVYQYCDIFLYMWLFTCFTHTLVIYSWHRNQATMKLRK